MQANLENPAAPVRVYAPIRAMKEGEQAVAAAEQEGAALTADAGAKRQRLEAPSGMLSTLGMPQDEYSASLAECCESAAAAHPEAVRAQAQPASRCQL